MEACLVSGIGSVDSWKLFEPLEIDKLEDAALGIILRFVES